jgi:hypothetical protein
MITFVMYVPGAKGKFITELCDLLTNSHHSNIDIKSGGHVSWTDKIDYVIDNDTNGIFPEDLHYQEYVKKINDKTILSNVQDLFVDVHYTNRQTIDYLLSNNHKVIFISTSEDDTIKLVDNFYYKNFIAPFYVGVNSLQKTKQIEGLLTDNYKAVKSLNDEDFDIVSPYFSKPFFQWSKDCYDVCYKMIRSSCIHKNTIINDITHRNFLHLEYKNISDPNTLQQVANLVSSGLTNKLAVSRFNSYTDSQSFGTYNEFIEKFILDFADKNVV